MLPSQSTDMPAICSTFKGCRACRLDSPVGRATRAAYARKHLPGFNLQGDWPCPFGRGAVGSIVALPRSRGLGDTIAKLAAPMAELIGLGEDCGCAGRQAALNALLPYKSADLPPKLG